MRSQQRRGRRHGYISRGERILTVVTTLRMQGRNVLDYVTAACEAALLGTAPPSLLPA